MKEFTKAKLTEALCLLEDYHSHHTADVITRFKQDGKHPDILVVSEPWKTKLRLLMGKEFPA
jgi:hypothetical protein